MYDRKLNKNTQLPEYGIADINGLAEALADIPTAVQTIGESTTQVMSQDATTKMVFKVTNPDQVNPNFRYGVAIGANASVGNFGGIAIGYNAKASRPTTGSIAIGQDSGGTPGNDTGDILSIGYNAKSSHQSIAIGNNSFADFMPSVAIGGKSYASNGIAIGKFSRVGTAPGDLGTSRFAIAIGNSSTIDTVATGEASIAIGSGTTTTAYNGGTTATHTNSIALGNDAHTGRSEELSIGNQDLPDNRPHRTRFIANVRDPELPQDAATKAYVDSHGGGVTPVQTTGQSTTDVMSQKATTDMIWYPDPTSGSVMAIGMNEAPMGAVANGKNITIFPNTSHYVNENSVVIGGRCNSTATTSSVSIGTASATAGVSTTAVGSNATATSGYSTALGMGAGCSASHSVAIGRGSSATNSYSIALGGLSQTTRSYELSVGRYSGDSFTRVIGGVSNPELETDAATKYYVDDVVDNAIASVRVPQDSTTEHDSGMRYIDGRVIYTRTYIVPSLPNNAQMTVPMGIGRLDKLVRPITGITTPYNNIQLPLPYVASASNGATAGIQLNRSGSDIVIITGVDRTAFGAEIIIHYVKTGE